MLKYTLNDKPQRLLQEVKAQLIRAKFNPKVVGLPELWAILGADAARVESGVPIEGRSLFELMRGPSHLFVPNVFEAMPVERVGAVSPDLRFFDVLAPLAGPTMAILTSIVDTPQGQEMVKPKAHAHLGEEIICLREGEAGAEWARYNPTTNRFAFERHSMSALPFTRTLWLKSRVPHRLNRKDPSVKEITFYSDAQGPHAIHRGAGLGVSGFGVRQFEDRDIEDTELMWRTWFAVGPRLDSIRTQKGISALMLSQRSALNNSAISRLEAGGRSPQLDEILSLAYAVDVLPGMLCPTTFDKSVILGCYAWKQSEVDRLFPELGWRCPPPTTRGRDAEKPVTRMPILWKDTGMLGTLCSSPNAGHLIGMHIFFGESDAVLSWDSYQSSLGRFNLRVMTRWTASQASGVSPREQAQSKKFVVSPFEVAVLCLEGGVNVEIQRWPQARLFPALAAISQDVGPNVTQVRLESKSHALVYIRPGHGFRLVPGSGTCNLLCVLSSRSGVAGAVDLPAEEHLRTLRALMDEGPAKKPKRR